MILCFECLVCSLWCFGSLLCFVQAGRTPLMIAAMLSRTEVVSEFLSHEDINIDSIDQVSLLCLL